MGEHAGEVGHQEQRRPSRIADRIRSTGTGVFWNHFADGLRDRRQHPRLRAFPRYTARSCFELHRRSFMPLLAVPALANGVYLRAPTADQASGIMYRSGAGQLSLGTLSTILDLIGSAAQGDVLYRGAASWARLGAGTSGHFLKTQGAAANPTWAAATGSDPSAPQLLEQAW